MKTRIEILNFEDRRIAGFEAFSLSRVFASYAAHSQGEEIMEIGFNHNSGYVYIALENGISIASKFGRLTEFILFDHETGEEKFFEYYHKAEEYLNQK